MTVYAGYSLATVAELTAIASTDRTDRLVLYVGEKNRWYRYDPSSSELANNDNVINPDDSDGRWVAVGAAVAPGDGDGGGSSVGVQNGRPTETPTATGIIIADSRDDRGVLWVSVGTNSPDDWQVFGFRPIVSDGYSSPLGRLTPDFIGQQWIYTSGGEYGSTTIYVGTGYTNRSWREIYYYSSS